jgi:hypothetical protein
VERAIDLPELLALACGPRREVGDLAALRVGRAQ